MPAKRPPDPRGGHVRIYWDLLDSTAWRALAYTSQSLYVAMRRQLKNTNNGNLGATLGHLKHYGWNSSATLAKALRELQVLGFIALTRQGGIAYGQKVCCLYRFTDEQVLEFPKLAVKAMPATNEWRKITTLGEAKAALASAHTEARRTPQPTPTQNKTGLQKLNQLGSVPEASGSFDDSESEGVAVADVQNLKQTKRRSRPAKPRPA